MLAARLGAGNPESRSIELVFQDTWRLGALGASEALREESEGESCCSPGFPTFREFLLKTWKPRQAAFTHVPLPPHPLF